MTATSTEVAIATTTLGSAAASITFSSIPNTYTDLRIVLTGTTSATALIESYLNSSITQTYSITYLGGNGTSASSSRDTNFFRWQYNHYTNTSTTEPFLLELDILSYAGSTNKTALSRFSCDKNGSGSTEQGVLLWRNTAAITTVQFNLSSGNYNTGTTATLYGIL